MHLGAISGQVVKLLSSFIQNFTTHLFTGSGPRSFLHFVLGFRSATGLPLQIPKKPSQDEGYHQEEGNKEPAHLTITHKTLSHLLLQVQQNSLSLVWSGLNQTHPNQRLTPCHRSLIPHADLSVLVSSHVAESPHPQHPFHSHWAFVSRHSLVVPLLCLVMGSLPQAVATLAEHVCDDPSIISFLD